MAVPRVATGFAVAGVVPRTPISSSRCSSRPFSVLALPERPHRVGEFIRGPVGRVAQLRGTGSSSAARGAAGKSMTSAACAAATAPVEIALAQQPLDGASTGWEGLLIRGGWQGARAARAGPGSGRAARAAR